METFGAERVKPYNFTKEESEAQRGNPTSLR